jgi:hypothetical protein
MHTAAGIMASTIGLSEYAREYLANLTDSHAHADFRPHRDKPVGPSLELAGVGGWF